MCGIGFRCYILTGKCYVGENQLVMYNNEITGIYRILSPANGVYIGQSRKMKQRFSNHRNLFCAAHRKLYASLVEHGARNHRFEIAHQLPIDVSQEVLDEYEIFYRQQYEDCGFEMLNMQTGGLKGRPSEESRRRLSESHMGKQSRKPGFKHSEETRAKLSSKRRLRQTKESTRAKMSESMKLIWAARKASGKNKL